jgi:hypothetical protein
VALVVLSLLKAINPALMPHVLVKSYTWLFYTVCLLGYRRADDRLTTATGTTVLAIVYAVGCIPDEQAIGLALAPKDTLGSTRTGFVTLRTIASLWVAAMRPITSVQRCFSFSWTAVVSGSKVYHTVSEICDISCAIYVNY